MSRIDELCQQNADRLLDNYLRDFLINALYSILQDNPTITDAVIKSLLKITHVRNDKIIDPRIKIKNFQEIVPASVRSSIPDRPDTSNESEYNRNVDSFYINAVSNSANRAEFRKTAFFIMDYAAISNIYRDVFANRTTLLPDDFKTAVRNMVVNRYPDFLKDFVDLHDLRNNKSHVGNENHSDIDILKSGAKKAIRIINAHSFQQNSRMADLQQTQKDNIDKLLCELSNEPISLSELKQSSGFDENKFKASILYNNYDPEKQLLYFCDVPYIESVFSALDVPFSFSAKYNIKNLFSVVPELKETGVIDTKIFSSLLDISIFTADADFWTGKTESITKDSIKNTEYIEEQLLVEMKKKSASFFVDWNTFSYINNCYADKTNPSHGEFRAPYMIIDLFSREKDNPRIVIGKKISSDSSNLSENGLLRFAQIFSSKLFFVFHINRGKNDPFLEEIKSHRIKNVVPVNLHYFSELGDNISPYTIQIQDHDYFLKSIQKITGTSEKENNQKAEGNEHSDVSQEAAKTIEEGKSISSETQKPVRKDSGENSTDSHYYTSSGQQITLLSKIGYGGEGSIYETDTGQAAKILNKSFCTSDRERKMIYQTKKNPHIEELCWPEDVLYDTSHQFAGILMPCVRNYKEMSISVLKLGDETVQKDYPKWNRLSLIKICAHICEIFIWMNKQNILMGDVNPRNILVNMDKADGSDIRFVDCDSYQVGEFLCPVGTVIFTNPEMYNRVNENTIDYSTIPRIQKDENFSLAVLVFNILMLNQIPFAVKGGSDLKELMRNHEFAYSNPDYKPGENVSNDNSPPDGPFELIWQNMIPDLRRLLYSVFKEGKDVSASELKSALSKYSKSVSNGNNTDYLIPRLHWERPGRNKRYTVFSCDLCGEETDMYYRQYNRFQSEGRPKFCRLCYALVNEEMRTAETNHECPMCHNRYSNVFDEWEANWRFEMHISDSVRCFRCKNKVPFQCPSCNKTKYIDEKRLKKYKKAYCDDCNKSSTVACEGWNCSNLVNERVWRINQLHSEGKRVLCNECQEAIRIRKRY